MMSNAAELSKYAELVDDKNETLGSTFSDSFSLSSASSLRSSQSLSKMSPVRTCLVGPSAEKRVAMDTCLLGAGGRPASQEFTCKICLSKFPLRPTIGACKNAHLFSSSSLDAPYSSSTTSLDSSSRTDDDNRIFQIESCKCRFCSSCLNMYIQQSIKNFNVSPLHCPDSKCGAKGFISPAEVKYLLDGTAAFVGDINDNLVISPGRSSKPAELFEKYLKICENIEILRNPNKIHCPQPDCQNVCIISPSGETGRSLRNAKVACDKCRHEFCSTCFKKWSQNEPRSARNDEDDDIVISSVVVADDNAPLNTSILLEKSPVIEKKKSRSWFDNDDEMCLCHSHGEHSSTMADKDDDDGARQKCLFDNLENIKRCPKCSVLIEKADGCAQIMCKMCKHTFCFYCLTSLDNDFLLKHYTKSGPCKGKLGHSRLSLLFHRFSVVAIFGGTILLIILLSPFLLLSLPCLVFSRKFRKSCFKLSSKFG